MDSRRRIERIWRWYKRRPSVCVRNAIVEHYYEMLKREAERLHRKLPASVAIDDLISDGGFGLLEAIESFSPGRSRFETFGRRRIHGAMLDGLRSRDEISRTMRSTARKLEAARDEIRGSTGGEPTPQQVAERLGLPMEEYLRLERQARGNKMHSLSSAPSSRMDRDELLFVDSIADQRQVDPRRHLDHESVKTLVTTGFSRAERLIIVLYYYEQMNMREIGQVLDLSESRVCQMHSAILKRLRAHLRPEELMV